VIKALTWHFLPDRSLIHVHHGPLGDGWVIRWHLAPADTAGHMAARPDTEVFWSPLGRAGWTFVTNRQPNTQTTPSLASRFVRVGAPEPSP
jgi:hypothetical protein